MKYFLFLIFTCCLTSCNQQGKSDDKMSQDEKFVDVDSLNQVFLSGWNNQDSAAIMNTINDNAVVMNDSLIHKGRDAIATKWISGGVKVINNVRTNPLTEDADRHIAYQGGTYTLNITPPGGPILKEMGNYSLVWKKEEDNNWKLTMIHIEDITQQPDVFEY
jgi:ketosteroid isomerase-like protein